LWQASQADIDLTKKLGNGAKLFDIQVLDHIIITSESYYSFDDEDLFFCSLFSFHLFKNILRPFHKHGKWLAMEIVQILCFRNYRPESIIEIALTETRLPYGSEILQKVLTGWIILPNWV